MNKILKFLLGVIALVSLKGCVTFKDNLVQDGGREEFIHNAILDFSNSTRLFKKDSVFSVSFDDTLYRMSLHKISDGNSAWIKGKPYVGIKTVNIIGTYNKMLLTDSTKVGSKGYLPSRYVEKDGKLFYWWDNDYPLTEETLAVFEKYNILQDDAGGWLKFPDMSTDDAKKGADYYFCENDLTNYKKVITNIAIGYYDAPKLNCNS
ncbi:hypothetical protein LB467_12670 [Salegentibacter sp. JZCK2]|uniref:hypothetical protein n=1 Tax=Salegentibacter tibetensis TaxID=2873600 RepID=UPI001CC956C3|nr:hypothetical protein [Salegentibacter tibetensis]MBZ9730540.1 hypothetical protein [Salegentibacter tibetensis]